MQVRSTTQVLYFVLYLCHTAPVVSCTVLLVLRVCKPHSCGVRSVLVGGNMTNWNTYMTAAIAVHGWTW
jgi:hypothetical protein